MNKEVKVEALKAIGTRHKEYAPLINDIITMYQTGIIGGV